MFCVRVVDWNVLCESRGLECFFVRVVDWTVLCESFFFKLFFNGQRINRYTWSQKYERIFTFNSKVKQEI